MQLFWDGYIEEWMHDIQAETAAGLGRPGTSHISFQHRMQSAFYRYRAQGTMRALLSFKQIFMLAYLQFLAKQSCLTRVMVPAAVPSAMRLRLQPQDFFTLTKFGLKIVTLYTSAGHSVLPVFTRACNESTQENITSWFSNDRRENRRLSFTAFLDAASARNACSAMCRSLALQGSS